MKCNENRDDLPSIGPQLIYVHFVPPHPTTVRVCVAGRFHNWRSEDKKTLSIEADYVEARASSKLCALGR